MLNLSEWEDFPDVPGYIFLSVLIQSWFTDCTSGSRNSHSSHRTVLTSKKRSQIIYLSIIIMEKNQLDHLQPPRISSVAFTSVRSYDCDPTPACGRPRSPTRTCFHRIKDDTDATIPSLSSSVRHGDCFVSARNSRSADVMCDPLSDHSSAKQDRMHWKEAPRTTSFLTWSERKQPWSCSACTFVNENVLHLSCSVCGTQRGQRFS